MALTYGTLRYHLHRKLYLAAVAGAQLGIVSEQVVKLGAGSPVTFTAAQLASLFPDGQVQHPSLPADYGSGTWTLTGSDTLTADA